MDDFFHSIEFYTLALLVAFALLALIFGQKDQDAMSTYIKPMELGDGGDQASELHLISHADGALEVRHNGLMLLDGDTVNLVVTVSDSKVRMVEKKGVKGTPGQEKSMAGKVLLDFMREQKFVVRYESEVTGEWRRFSYVNREGNEKKISLKY